MRTAQLQRAPAAPAPPGAVTAAHPVTGTPAGGDPPGTAPARRRPAALRRVRQLRETTPGRLQLILLGLLTLTLAVGATCGLTARSAALGAHDLGTRTQPLLIEAETIYSALADADATAAQAFLAGGLEPRALTDRYDADLARASTALASAARRTSADGPAAEAVATLTSGMSQYAGLIATARANNRQGLPVGASYLSTASALNRTQLQPQAKSLLEAARGELDAGYADARSNVWVALLMLLLTALLVGLLLAQRHLSRSTRRTFNIPLVSATVLAAVLAVAAGGVLTAERSHLRAADSDGSTPVAMLAEARILTLQERSDEALTLAGHGSDASYQKNFTATAAQLSGPAGLLARAARAVSGDARTAAQQAADSHDRYLAAHGQVHALDTRGDYDGAVKLAIGPQTTATFTALTDHIGQALENRKAAFDQQIGAAGRGLGLLSLLGPVLALIICALAAAGIRARLEEYR